MMAILKIKTLKIRKKKNIYIYIFFVLGYGESNESKINKIYFKNVQNCSKPNLCDHALKMPKNG